MKKILLLKAAALACGLAMATPAQATLVLTAGSSGNDGTDNVIFNASCVGANSGPAQTVQGCLNTSSTTFVDFTSSEDLEANGGQALVAAADGSFNDLTIAFNDAVLGFSTLIFNLNANDDGTATFQAVDNFGTIFDLGTFPIDGDGQNFFRLDSIDDQIAMSFSIVSTTDLFIEDIRQVRIGGIVATPLPPAGLLFVTGLVGLGFLSRKIRKKRQTS